MAGNHNLLSLNYCLMVFFRGGVGCQALTLSNFTRFLHTVKQKSFWVVNCSFVRGCWNVRYLLRFTGLFPQGLRRGLSSGKPAMRFTAEPFLEGLALATDHDPLFEALGANDFGPS